MTAAGGDADVGAGEDEARRCYWLRLNSAAAAAVGGGGGDGVVAAVGAAAAGDDTIYLDWLLRLAILLVDPWLVAAGLHLS